MAVAHGAAAVAPSRPTDTPAGGVREHPVAAGVQAGGAGVRLPAFDRTTRVVMAAVAASVAVHAAVAIIPAASGSWSRSVGEVSAGALQVVIPEAAAAVAPLPDLMRAPALPTMTPIAPKRLSPVASAIEAPPNPQLPASEFGVAAPREGVASPLVALARLGDLQDRWQSEFPAEVELPPRVFGELKVPYPAAAVEQRVEGDVVVWAIINPDGSVDDIRLTEGNEIFHDAVATALRGARYYPAAYRGRNISYPIALEISFSLDDASQNAALASQPQK